MKLSDLAKDELTVLIGLLTPMIRQQLALENRPVRERTYRRNLVVDDATDRKLAFAVLTEKTFAAAGFKNNIAHETILTRAKWASRGFEPREGQKAVRVKNLGLYHQSQMKPIVGRPQAVTAAEIEAFNGRQTVAKPSREELIAAANEMLAKAALAESMGA